MSIAIQTYRNSAEQNRVDKTGFLSFVNTINGVLRGETSVTDITIRIESNTVPEFNYVYIEAFKRWYFVNDIVHIRRSLWEIVLAVDVLMTYKEGILNTNAFIDRNEYTSNPLLVDKKRIIECGVDIETHEIENDVLVVDSEQSTYIINGFSISATRIPTSNT